MRMRSGVLPVFWVWVLAALPAVACQADVVTRLPTKEKVLALTFDGCETVTPSYVDESIAAYLAREKIPFTLFASGKFARRNRERLAELAALPFVELENHSDSHHLHMERLSRAQQQGEVIGNEAPLAAITGRKPRFFRFPGGYYDGAALKAVEDLGYRVVHWSFASGDPDRHLSAERLYRGVVEQSRPGGILIFHINGRGYQTGAALPRIVETLRQRGYRFVRLDELL
ncbi:polysaccharide deacetylase family protein [Methylogaea oryzae]|uniref:Polysaccharide deacetylase n=1 Tax=Methylogaea oryzae TaxID=1295382 RepID=A0A8D4VQZ0_9GAMM|nr:polysaccharide deacetylase family protein [Methylogaea oryzae]BBL71709.1 polysaccharide deacetylase [Methylogaea oryzae]